MSTYTQIALRADSVGAYGFWDTGGTPIVDNNRSMYTFDTLPTADPISDAVNNVRFAVRGSATNLGSLQTGFWTEHTFNIHPQRQGRLKAVHAHFMPQGDVSLIASAPTWWFDGAGMAGYHIWGGMDVIVAEKNYDRLAAHASSRSLFMYMNKIYGEAVTVTSEETVDADLLQWSRTLLFDIPVNPSHEIRVTAKYDVLWGISSGAAFKLDFAAVSSFGGEPGDGLNVPFVAINIED